MTGPISASDFERLRAVRFDDPGAIAKALKSRTRRPMVADDGRLLIIAADHPGRGALAVRNDPTAMADRHDLLQRLAIALSRPGVDGVLGTADILEDLALLGLLENRVAVGSMNRGGLRGAVFEMDDRSTGYDIPSIVSSGLDAAKLLLRVNYSDHGSAATLERSAHAVSAASAAGVPIMIEPFLSARRGDQIVNDLSTQAVITSVAIASALGTSTAYSWLKLPVVADMERVVAASTLPVLLLGGDPEGRPDSTYSTWEAALRLQGVRGLVVGRTLLYPPDGDVAAAVDIAANLVHAVAKLRSVAGS